MREGFFKQIIPVFTSICFMMIVPTALLAGNGERLTARIKVDIERKTGEIDKKIYGNFTEHLGRCIYGGIHDPSSPEADGNGFRKDVAEAARNLNVSILRWPGGNFVSGYHWEDGIGSRDRRPKRIDLAWGDVEDNRIGTDEFLAYCRLIGAEPYICINMGTGSWDEARNWVEYCNRESGTYYSDLRIKNGNIQPYKVIYWGLGNEIDGPWQMGHRDADDYGKYALEAAKLMKWIDPSIKLVASGSSDFGGDWIHWNRTVLDYLKNHVDYISLHTYLGNRDNNYYKFLANTTAVEDRIQITEGLIREALTGTKRETPIYIAFDEYNVWYRAWTEQKLEETYNLEDALVVASFLNCFVRNARIVKIANMAQLVNVIAPMKVDNGSLWLQTIYHPLRLFASYCSGTALETFIDCETYDVGEFKKVPYLDVSSAYNDKTGELVLNVVNRHRDTEIETAILNQFGRFDREAAVYEVNGPDIKSSNSPTESPVAISEKKIATSGDRFTYRFPAHSYTMVIVKMVK